MYKRAVVGVATATSLALALAGCAAPATPDLASACTEGWTAMDAAMTAAMSAATNPDTDALDLSEARAAAQSITAIDAPPELASALSDLSEALLANFDEVEKRLESGTQVPDDQLPDLSALNAASEAVDAICQI